MRHFFPLLFLIFSAGALHAQADGKANAPKIASGPQLPNFFAGYCATCRPPWPVAGVDFPVGIPDGIALKDPTLPSSYPGGVFPQSIIFNPKERFIRAIGPASVFEGMDFCRGGGPNAIGIYWKGTGQLTIKNAHFCGGDGKSPPIFSDVGTGPVDLSYFSYDGNGAMEPLLRHNGCGAGVRYGYMRNAGADFINPGGECAKNEWLIAYNVFQNGGVTVGSHPDWIQVYSKSHFVSFRVIGNTAAQQSQAVTTQGWLGASSATAWDFVEVSENTSKTIGQRAASYIVFPLGGSISKGLYQNNYADVSGAFGFYYGGMQAVCTKGIVCHNNIDMKTGRPLTR